MGQEQSQEVVREVSREELSHELALKFAEKCYSQLELYCFKQVFNNLADAEADVKYWSEASLCRYLELPDALGVGPVIYQMATFLGAFPFPSQAPCIVTKEALIKVVTIMTERYTRVLKRGNQDRMRLLYGALSVYDRRVSEALKAKPHAAQDLEGDKPEVAVDDPADVAATGVAGFSIDNPVDDYDEEDEDDDTLALAALDALDAIDAIKLGEKPETQHSFIPTDNLLKLIELLLLVAPLGAQESVSKYAMYLDDKGLEQLRQTAGDVVSTFGIEEVPGINYRTFKHVIPILLPYMFDGLGPLFEHFLFNKDFDLSKRRRRSSQTSQEGQSPVTEQFPSLGQRRRSSGSGTEPFPAHPGSSSTRRASVTAVRTRVFSTSSTIPEDAVVKSPTSPTAGHGSDYFDAAKETPPLLPDGDHLLTYPMLSQLAFFLSPALIFRRLHHLYAGSEHGFSINSLNTSVSTWTGPSILLVSGSLLSPSSSSTEGTDSRERNFHHKLPPRRYQPNGKEGSRVLYGAYLPMQLRPTHRAPLSDTKSLLFQLGPTHDVFPASTLNTAHLTFSNASTDPVPGVGVGCALPLPASVSGSQHAVANLGAVSLHLDDALEFGVFTHTAAGGGSFKSSIAPQRRDSSWEDRFEVEAIEMWGIGGETQVRDQKRALEFEEREARLRREGRGSVSAGGVEADRELLRMAGIIGQHSESGGSMS